MLTIVHKEKAAPFPSLVTSCNANKTATIIITPDEVSVIALAVLFKSEAIELQSIVDLPVVSVPHS
ncbi:hypothetical protein [Crassaminicella profunda]|uniref:hypothetical protein n=1 Tax=Crassaminicella profunda TaxID=1286698 RepID=UPI001CA6E4FE|nr:hypothetical protein [Crassaminicella profunda]QZY57169.1 hypothetical protein K7H06_09720 [Crassaminicella profunda]